MAFGGSEVVLKMCNPSGVARLENVLLVWHSLASVGQIIHDVKDFYYFFSLTLFHSSSFIFSPTWNRRRSREASYFVASSTL